MDIKKSIEKARDFALKRLIELISFLILLLSLLILTALISYSPDDPNFIYSENQEINNILGINGSIGADFLLQSIGLTSYFLPITFIFLSITIFYNKNLIKILNSLFYIVCYSIVGSIFLTQFYKEAFFLIINGNGGFIGSYFYEKIFFNIANINVKISYYAQLSLFTISFLMSINFRLIWFLSFKNIFKKKK